MYQYRFWISLNRQVRDNNTELKMIPNKRAS